jgi:excisionase family DNA binding protein
MPLVGAMAVAFMAVFLSLPFYFRTYANKTQGFRVSEIVLRLRQSENAPYTRRVKGYMNVKEAAKELGITPRAVEYHVKVGNLDAERVSDRMFLIKDEEVQRFAQERAESGRQKPGPPKGRARPPKESPDA